MPLLCLQVTITGKYGKVSKFWPIMYLLELKR